MNDAQRRIIERLEKMADKACDCIEQSLSSRARGQQQQSNDAWNIIRIVLAKPASEADEELAPVNMTMDELAEKRALIRKLTHGR